MSQPIEIDRSALLELARGSNLYTDALAPLRELVSNAIDATLIRVFLEGAAPPTDQHSLARLRELLAKRPIDVGLSALPDAVRIRLRDRGTGIDEADLPFVGVLGASHKNPARRAAIEAMPEWMRPTGTFGIGLHSVFLCTDTLTLRTRARSSEATRVLVFTCVDEGVNLEVREARDEEALEGPGTEAIVDVPHPAVWEFVRRRAWERDVFSFDPLLDALPEAALGAVRACLSHLALGGLVPLSIEGRTTHDVFRGRASFDPETGVELARLEPIGVRWTENDHNPHRYYRGAQGAAFRLALPLRLAINLHFGTGRVLTMAREAIASGQRAAAEARIAEAFRRIGPRWLDPHSGETAPESEWPWIARALSLSDRGASTTWMHHAQHAEVLTVGERVITLGEVAAQPHLDVDDVAYRISIPEYELHAVQVNEGFRRDLAQIFPARRLLTPTRTRFGSESGATREASADLLAPFRHAYQRVLFPCPDGYRALAISGQGALAARIRGPKEHDVVMLLPYRGMKGVITVPRIADWVRLIAANTIDGPVEPQTLALPTLRFLVDFDDDVRRTSTEGDRPFTIEYELSALREALIVAFGPLPSIESVRAALDAEKLGGAR